MAREDWSLRQCVLLQQCSAVSLGSGMLMRPLVEETSERKLIDVDDEKMSKKLTWLNLHKLVAPSVADREG